MKKIIKKTSWILLIFMILVIAGFVAAKNNLISVKKTFSQKTISPNTFTLPNKQTVTSPVNLCNIKNFGAVANDYSKAKENRRAIQKAITECVNSDHGLFIPSGTWYTGSLYFNKDNSWLIIDPQATLSFIYDPELYKPLRPSRFEGYELINFSAPIYFDNIAGGGIIGGGKIKIEEPKKWHHWDKYENTAKKQLLKFSKEVIPLANRIFGKVSDGLRPPFVQLYNTQNFVLDNIRVQDSTMWTIHCLYSDNILIQNLNIYTDGSNTDGIVIDSSSYITLKNNTLRTGDDAIVLKSGSDEDGRRVNKPTKNIIIQDTVVNDAHGGIVIGSEMTGGIENVTIKNTTIIKADVGLRIKTRPGRGGYIRNINLDKLNADETRSDLFRINAHYRQSIGQGDILSELYPEIENITFNNVTANKVLRTFMINGFTNHPIKNINLSNITVTTQQKTSKIKNTTNKKLQNINISFENNTRKDKELIKYE